MDEQIISAIEQFAKDKPDMIPNEKVYAQIRANAKAFERLAKNYTMQVSFDNDHACLVQFTAEEKIYTTYTFYQAVVAEAQKT